MAKELGTINLNNKQDTIPEQYEHNIKQNYK